MEFIEDGMYKRTYYLHIEDGIYKYTSKPASDARAPAGAASEVGGNALLLSMVWYGMVWYGMVWYGIV